MAEKLEILNPDGLNADPTNLTVVLHEEDHTIGNSLKHIICQMPDVEFCGYNVPHPLEDKIVMRVQTNNDVSAIKVFTEALGQLQSVFASIRDKFTSAHEDYQQE